MTTSRVSSYHLETLLVELAPLEDIAQALTVNICASNKGEKLASNFSSECEKLIGEGQLQGLVELFVDAIGSVGDSSDIEDTESRFAILFSLARHLPQDKLTLVAPRVAKVVLSIPAHADAGKDTKMRLSVLKNLYGAVDPKSESRYGTLLEILKYSMDHNNFYVLEHTSVCDVSELCAMWTSSADVKLDKSRVLYKYFCDLCEKKRSSGTFSRSEELKQCRFLLEYLGTFESADPATLEKLSSYASRAAVISIKYPLPGDLVSARNLDEQLVEGLSAPTATVLEVKNHVNTSVLTATPLTALNFAALKHLANVPAEKTLFGLLTIFAVKGIEQYNSFIAANPNVLSQNGLEPEMCLQNIRLLTLASLAAEKETMTYDEVSAALHIDASLVETWIIDAIMAQLIDVKMDQLTQTIVINRGSQRLLVEDQWLIAQKKLNAWKSSVHDILHTIQSLRQEQQT